MIIILFSFRETGLLSSDGDRYRTFRASVSTARAEYAFRALHIPFLYHPVHIETHRACPRTGIAVNTADWIGVELESRPSDRVPDLAAGDHQDRDRAEDAAEPAPAHEVRDAEDKKEDDDDDNQGGQRGNRKTIVSIIEGIDRADPPGPDEEVGNQGKPEHRDPVLDPGAPAFLNRMHNYRRTDLLPGPHRADPAAPEAGDEEREEEDRNEEDHAAGGYAFCSTHQDNDGRDIEERDGEEEERDDEDPLPDLLAGQCWFWRGGFCCHGTCLA